MKRKAIFFFYDEKGIVRNYVLYYLQALQTITKDIVFVSNGELQNDSYQHVLSITNNVIIRENVGYDMWAFKEALEKISSEEYHTIDELIYCNFTAYGPFFPFETMFSEMDSRDCDFWGAAKHPEQPNYLLPNLQGYIYEHIMSYFWVIRRRMLQSVDFKQYIAEMPPIISKNDSVGLIETQFTHHFERLGYISNSYVDVNHYNGRCDNLTIFRPDEMLINDHCPLVKRRSFMFPQYESILRLSSTHPAHDLMKYIRENTNYPEKYIWEDLLQTQKISVLMNNMHLMHILPVEGQTHTSSSSSIRLAFIGYVSSIDRLNLFVRYFSVLPQTAQIVLVYEDEAFEPDIVNKIGAIVQKCDLIKIDAEVNRLHQVLELCQNVFEITDYCCLMLQEENLQDRLQLTNEDTSDYLLKSMVGNVSYLNSLLSLFQTEPFLGMLSPNTPNYSSHYARDIAIKNKYHINKWEKMYRALNLNVIFDLDIFIPLVPVCWTRSKVIKAISGREYLGVFQNADEVDISFFLPMLIQSEGFYTSLVTSTALAEEALVDHAFIKRKLVNQIFQSVNQRAFSAHEIESIIKNKSKRTISKHDTINSSYTLSEITYIAKRFIKGKLKRLRNRISPPISSIPSRALIANVTEEGDRAVFLITASKARKLSMCSLLLQGKRYYSLKQLSELQIYLQEHFRSAEQDCAFFELPIEKIRNEKISLRSPTNRRLGLTWWVTMSYDALQFRKYNIYMRIENGELFCQTKSRFVFSVLYSRNYHFREKLLFTLSLLNPFHPVTLYAENGGAADNAFQLYQHALTKNRFSYFIASPKIIENQKDPAVKKHMIVSNSRKHVILTLLSSLCVSSWTLFLESLPRKTILKDIHYATLPIKWVFVPHGMAIGDKLVAFLVKYNWGQPSLICTNSEYEKNAFRSLYSYDNVIYQGSPRMDKWFGASLSEKDIVVFFTWRIDHKDADKAHLADTVYCRTIVSAMAALRNACPEHKIHYIFHHEVVRSKLDTVLYQLLEGFGLDFIYLNNTDGISAFNNVLRYSKYLITDFSSVAYDFAYKEGAIPIYYLPEDFVHGHYKLRSFFYQVNMGVIAHNEEEIVSALMQKQPTDEMKNRRSKFFQFTDNKNSERVYNVIHSFKYQRIRKNTSYMPKKTVPAKRLGIFFYYDALGIVDEYIPFYLDGLKTVCDRIHVVVNGTLNDEGEHLLRKHCDNLLIRENVGFDSWAYKEAIEQIGYDEVNNSFDELVLCNFTMFGPIYPFTDMFHEMEKHTCDFWGHNRYKGHNSIIGNSRVVDHLQSYFIVFKKSILSSPSFKRYWQTLGMPKSYQDAISCHELRCTAYFEKLGFISDSYMPFEKYSKIGSHNTPVNLAYTQLVEDRSPLLKRKVFFVENGIFCHNFFERHSRYAIIRWLKRHTDYDVNLVWANLNRTLPLTEGVDTPEKRREYRRISIIAWFARFAGHEREEKWLRKKNEYYFPKRFQNSFHKDVNK